MSIFCTATNTLIEGFTLPKIRSPIVGIQINTAQISRCFFLGSSLPLSVNMLKTKIAESKEVTK